MAISDRLCVDCIAVLQYNHTGYDVDPGEVSFSVRIRPCSGAIPRRRRMTTQDASNAASVAPSGSNDARYAAFPRSAAS